VALPSATAEDGSTRWEITVKVVNRRGEGIAHSSVARPRFAGALLGRQRVRSRFQKKMSVAIPMRNAPMVRAD